MRAIKGKEVFTQAEKLAAYAWFFGMLKAGELAHTLFLRGGLEADYWHGSLAFYRAYWTTPGFSKYWVDRRQAFTPVFRTAVDAWMADLSETVTRTDKLFSTDRVSLSDRQSNLERYFSRRVTASVGGSE